MPFTPIVFHKDNRSVAHKRCIAAAIIVGGFVSLASAADDGENPTLLLRGFGTLGGVESSEEHADYVSGFFEPNGAGYTHRLAIGVDTKIGLQADARFNDKLTAVLQLVTQHHYDNSYEPRIEWANIKYQVTPDLDIRLGRTVTMPFMVSDSRLVGYGNLWVRPPQEVYGLIPITNKDGIDASYRIQMESMTDVMRASYGQTRLKLPASGSVEAKQYIELSNSLEYGATTLRASYSSGEINLHTGGFDALMNGLSTFSNTLSSIPGFETAGSQALDLASKYRFENAPISVISLGASYDREQWLFMTEWALFNGHSLLSNSSAWYATLGYRVREFTPYFTIAKLQADKTSESGISTTGMPPVLAATATALNDGLNTALTGQRFAQKSLSVGIRWDFMKNAVLKTQYDYIILDSDSSGRLGNVQPEFKPGGKLNVFSIALDFTF